VPLTFVPSFLEDKMYANVLIHILKKNIAFEVETWKRDYFTGRKYW